MRKIIGCPRKIRKVLALDETKINKKIRILQSAN